MIMNRINSTFINGIENLPDQALYQTLEGLDRHSIGCVNWQEFPYRPSVGFHIAHSDKSVAILFEVTEDHVKAVTTEDNGPVWKDSCVEFFVLESDAKHYVNFEMNCIGAMLAARRTTRNDLERFTREQLLRIRRITSLPYEPTDSAGPGQTWWAIEVIPFTTLGYTSKPEALRANLYKCGDGCNQAHFLSWSPIDIPTPNFHRPDFFGEIVL